MSRGGYDEEGHSIKRMVIILLILFVIAVGSFFLIIKLLSNTEKDTVKSNGTKVEENVDSSTNDNKDQVKTEEDKKAVAQATEEKQQNQQETGIDSSQYTVEQLYYEIHLRANSIIVAEDDEIWEEMPINREFLDYTIELVKDKDEALYNMLLQWKNLDFSNAVDVHNYVWEKLGGTVGKATGLNQDVINSLVQSLSQ